MDVALLKQEAETAEATEEAKPAPELTEEELEAKKKEETKARMAKYALPTDT